MQYSNKEFDPEKHDRFPALTVKQPYASELLEFKEKATFGIPPEFTVHTIAKKSIEVRSRATKYRGDLLICSSINPEIAGLESGVTIGFVELYDIKPVSEFTPADWENTCIPEEKRKQIKGGYGWLMRNPRPVIEYPVKGQLGIWNMVYTKGDIMEYPEAVFVDKESYKILNNKGNE